jgi:phospholipid transport system substrate-binding protein
VVSVATKYLNKEPIMLQKSWRWAILLMVLVGWGLTCAASEAMTPTATIQGPVDDVITILKDPAFRGPDKKVAQRDKIWERIRGLFDFDEISRRTVGSKWNEFTPEEQKKFSAVFSEFLGNTYVEKLQGEYQDQKIIFLKELVREPLALVRTKLISKNTEIPIDYRLKKIDGRWLIYDILVEEGVSLVKNYRVQFQSALQKETPAQLIKQLEDKLAQQRAQPQDSVKTGS